MAELNLGALQRPDRPGVPAGFGCPDCGGALFELTDGELVRFRCRVGHAWSADSLLAKQSDALEEALWTALRALEEKAALSTRLMRRATDRGHANAAESFAGQARDAEQQATVIRNVLLNRNGPPGDAAGESA